MKYILTMTLLLGGAFAFSQESEIYNFSLSEAIDYALDHHTDVLNAMADEEAAWAQRNEIRGRGLPQINGSMDVTNYVKLPTSLIPAQIFDPNAAEGEFIPVQFGTKYNATAAIQASQLVFSGEYIVALQSSGTFVELSRKNTIKTKNDLAEAVAKSYYLLLVNIERLKLVAANLESLAKVRDQTKALYDAGFAEKIDYDRIRVSYNNLDSQQKDLTRFVALGYASLKFQMGMPLNSRLTLTDKLDESHLGELTLTEAGFNYTDRIEYQMVETRKKLAEQGLKLDKAAYLPNLVAYGNLSSQAQGNELFGNSTQWFPIGLVGATLSVPIFDGLQKNYRVQQSKIELLKTENSLRQLKQGIDLEIQAASVTLESTLSGLEDQRFNIELARSVFDTASKKYASGTGTSIEVVNAETELALAETNYYNALYEAIVAKIDYQKANGTLLESLK